MENTIHQSVKQRWKDYLSGDYVIITAIAFFKLLLHLVNPEYGYHRDELFYLIISDNLSFNNLDMLPLTPLYLKLVTTLLGTSLKALHFASALTGAVALVFTCLITRQLGGKTFSIALTGLCSLFSGSLIFGALFTYDSLEFLCVTCALYFLILLLKFDKPVYWIGIGIALGLGLLNKLTILFFCLSITVVLLSVSQRKQFRNKELWIAGGIAFLSLLPFILWQSNNNWYFMGWAGSYTSTISYASSLPEFIWNQILPNNVVNLPIWITGLILLLFSKKWNQYRFFGLNYLFLFLIIFLMGGKFYFLTPYYTVLLAVGSIGVESAVNRLKSPARKLFQRTLPVVYVLLSCITVPMMLPVLPVDLFIKYSQLMGMGADAGVRYENNQINQLPQHFADRFGWEELAKKIADLVNDLSFKDREQLGGILCSNYGEASAINFFRKKHDIPEAISAHGWYYFHTKQTHKFKDCYIAIPNDVRELEPGFEQVDSIGIFTNLFCMPYESNKKIYLCKKPRTDLKALWDTIKH